MESALGDLFKDKLLTEVVNSSKRQNHHKKKTPRETISSLTERISVIDTQDRLLHMQIAYGKSPRVPFQGQHVQ